MGQSVAKNARHFARTDPRFARTFEGRRLRLERPFQEAFHAWWDQVLGPSWAAEDDEEFSNYVHALIEQHLLIKASVACGALTTAEAKKKWDGEVANARSFVMPGKPVAARDKLISQFIQEFGDFEKVLPY